MATKVLSSKSYESKSDTELLNKLNKSALEKALRRCGIPLTDVSLNGYSEGRLCLDCVNKKWEVYTVNRGQRIRYSVHNSFKEACKRFIREVSDNPEREATIIEYYEKYINEAIKLNKINEGIKKISELVEQIINAQSVTIVNYAGLTVEQDINFRRQCRESEVDYCVLKNRLVKLALDQIGIEGLDDLLNGPNAFVFSKNDPASGPKAVARFIEKNKLEALKITGGIFEGKAVNEKTMINLSKLPSRNELIATLVSCLMNPINSLVAVLSEIAEKKESI